MKGAKWTVVLVLLLIISLGMNIYLGNQIRRRDQYTRQGFMWLANWALVDLNSFIKLVNDPNVDWNSPTFRLSLKQSIDDATYAAQATGSVMSGLTTGPRWQVASGLNSLSFGLLQYRSMVDRIANAADPVTPDQQAQLKALAAKLVAAGWPDKPLGTDDTQQWAQFGSVLQRLQELR
ncbi:MAG: hypothetical protein ACM3XM_16695 [Mycobacterium leprae]